MTQSDYICDYSDYMSNIQTMTWVLVMKKQLNAKAINALKPRGSPYRVSDDGDADTRGLLVQVTPAGSKTWFLSYTSPITKKRKFYKIGDTNAIRLSAARDAARAARILVERGIDPTEHKKQLEAEEFARKALGTLGELLSTYMAQLERDDKLVWLKQVKGMSRRHIPTTLARTQARHVTQQNIRDILRPIAANTKTTADHVRQMLSAAYSYAIEHRQPEYGSSINPAAGIKSFRSAAQKTRSRVLSLDEVKVLHAGLTTPWTRDIVRTNGRAQSHTYKTHDTTRIGIMLQLYTGQRVLEIIEARWCEFDLKSDVWSIPGERRKTRHSLNESHLVPLPAQLIGLLKELEPYSMDSGWLFPNTTGERPISRHTYRQSLNRVQKRLDMEPWQPRDLRRTFKTLAAQAGLGLEIRNRIQGHAFNDIGSRAYDRYDYWDEKVAAMERWVAWLDRQLSLEDADNVLPLPTRKSA